MTGWLDLLQAWASGAVIDEVFVGPFSVRIWGRIGKVLQLVGALTLIFELVGTVKLRRLGRTLIEGVRYWDVLEEVHRFHQHELGMALREIGILNLGAEVEPKLSPTAQAISSKFFAARLVMEAAFFVSIGLAAVRNPSGIVVGIGLWLMTAVFLLLLPHSIQKTAARLAHLPGQIATVNSIGWLVDRSAPAIYSLKGVGNGLVHPKVVSITQWVGLALVVTGSVLDLLAS